MSLPSVTLDWPTCKVPSCCESGCLCEDPTHCVCLQEAQGSFINIPKWFSHTDVSCVLKQNPDLPRAGTKSLVHAETLFLIPQSEVQPLRVRAPHSWGRKPGRMIVPRQCLGRAVSILSLGGLSSASWEGSSHHSWCPRDLR